MGSLKKSNEHGASHFQMPLHYPRYTEKDYLDMPEWKIDRLLAEYGLSAQGNLRYKQEYAIGAFLWPDFRPEPAPPVRAHCSLVSDSTRLDKKIK